MTIKLTQSMRFSGAVSAVGAVLTLDNAVEADLVQRGAAVWASDDPTVSPAARFDVIVVGATPAGVAAAVAAARRNKRVLLVSDSERLGGMMGWGITQTDVNVSATPAVTVGFAREVLERIGRRETNSLKTFQRFHRVSCVGRPSWFARSMAEIVAAEPNITTYYSANVTGVRKSGARILSVTLDGTIPHSEVAARTFIDATYTGDLVGLAGCTVSIGRESTALYSEAAAGVLAAGTWAGGVTLDPYVTAGNSSSGLLPGIDSEPLGTIGSGDGRVMGFGYRLFVTNTAGDRIPFPAPDMSRYNPQNYELLARAMAAAPTSYDTVGEIFTLYSLLTAGYSDLNNRTSCPASSNWISAECKEYITAKPARRAAIRETVKQWVLGLIYWIANSGDARIPAGLITNLATYGLSDEELLAYGGFSPELYVREGRRMVGDYVMRQADMTLANGVTDAIAYGYYDIDSHTVRRLVSGGNAVPEGSQLTALTAAEIGFAIPYRVLLPKRTECVNLFSPTAPSVSRVVWCSIRMEPILMAMGQAAGIAAAEVCEHNIDAQDLPIARLQRVQDIQRIWDGVMLSTDGTYSEGTITQTPGASWSATATRFGFVGASALSDGNTGKGKTLKFAPNIQETGAYRVLFRYPPSDTGRANNTTVTISHAGGTVSLTINQLYPGGKGGDWEDMGVYTFRAGSPSADYALVDTTATSDVVVASAFKFVPLA